MEAISKIIKNGLEQNAKELKSEILTLNFYKEILAKNPNFDFDIKIGYSAGDNLLELYYTIKDEEHEITIQFLMNELTFNFKCYEITSNLLKYAENYFNNKEFKINIGDFDGDDYVGIVEYIKSFYEKGDKINLLIYDETLDIDIYSI